MDSYFELQVSWTLIKSRLGIDRHKNFVKMYLNHLLFYFLKLLCFCELLKYLELLPIIVEISQNVQCIEPYRHKSTQTSHKHKHISAVHELFVCHTCVVECFKSAITYNPPGFSLGTSTFDFTLCIIDFPVFSHLVVSPFKLWMI